MDTITQAPAAEQWPDGVIARYLTVGAATVDITPDDNNPRDPWMRSVCSGCEESEESCHSSLHSHLETEARRKVVLQEARQWSQSHAEWCRAMPKPNGV